ncbi:uncharacterized protein METZ01_LOCUS301983, partial [marine metagenome]
MMDSDRNLKAQQILKKHINKLGSIYEKNEAEQKILDQKINNLKAELGILKNKGKDSAETYSIHRNKYI